MENRRGRIHLYLFVSFGRLGDWDSWGRGLFDGADTGKMPVLRGSGLEFMTPPF